MMRMGFLFLKKFLLMEKYCSDGAEEEFLPMCEEFNGLNCDKEHLVRYCRKTF